MDKGIDVSKTFAKNAGKKILKKIAKATGDLIGNKIADKITSASKKSHNEELQSDEVNNEIPKERYISPKERQKIIDELKLTSYNNGIPKIANLIDDTSNQPSKFRTRNWVEINDESRGTYNVNSQIKLKTTMLKSSLCDYSDAYIIVKGTITNNERGADAAARQADEKDKGVSFKNCAPLINCISEINNTQIDNAKNIDIVMPMYNLIEYSDNYAKTSGSLWQYFR